jgi:HK97 family phage major capsid protein
MSETTKLAELREKASAQFAEMRTMLDAGLTAESSEKYDRVESDYDQTVAEIKAEERLASKPVPVAPEARALAAPAVATEPVEEVEAPVEAEGDPVDSAEYRAAFDRYIRGGFADPEVRATMVAGTNANGGYSVTRTFRNELVKAIAEYSPLLQRATILNTSTGNPIDIPGGTRGQSPDYIAEAGTYTNSEDTMSLTSLSAFKAGHIVRVTEELLSDSAVNIDQFIRQFAAEAIGLKIGAWFATGDGTNKPTGITVGATVGVTGATGSSGSYAILADELFDVVHAVKRPYRQNAAWLMNDSTLKAVRKLKDSQNNYLFVPGLSAGEADTLLGAPVLTDPNISALGSNNVAAIYGDLSGYYIRQVGAPSIRVLSERFSDAGIVGFRVDTRVDGKLVDANRVTAYKCKA